MSLPVQTPPPPDPAAPTATQGVSVVPKTSAQQKRSAWYTSFAGAAAFLGGLVEAVQIMAPEIQKVLPEKWVHAFSMLTLGLSILALAKQRAGGVKDVSTVNYSDGGTP